MFVFGYVSNGKKQKDARNILHKSQLTKLVKEEAKMYKKLFWI